MIEAIKGRIWELIKDKKVSLAMIFDKSGAILWARGREITGATIFDGRGFCSTFIKETIKKNTGKNSYSDQPEIISIEEETESRSARILQVKSVIIHPIDNKLYLYADSGIKTTFSSLERELFNLTAGFLKDSIDRIRWKVEDMDGISGNSEAVRSIKEKLLSFCVEEDPILLTGETGTGKSHIARIIHEFSGRKGRFEIIHLPGIPENLLESTLFGHKKGAFTGADYDKPGLVEAAAGGTIFLDEITEAPGSIQTKLLQFIETRHYRTLGDPMEKRSDVRIIAASNRNLKDAISQKVFRLDLYYRISTYQINIPPLRERKPDIRQLVLEHKHLLRGKQPADGFWEKMENHSWPGNVRELLAVLKRLGKTVPYSITGKEVEQCIDPGLGEDSFFCPNCGESYSHIWTGFEEGKNFWELIREPFLNRDLNRREVQGIILEALNRNGHKFINLLEPFNIPKKDYKKFVNFLRDHDLK